VTVRLRPHHLLCVLTYVGRGYSPVFTANYNEVVARLGNEEDIVLVEGPDDICEPLLASQEAHCRRRSVSERDMRASRAISVLLDMTIEPGLRFGLTENVVTDMRAAFSRGSIRPACTGCEWGELCSSVAAGGYNGTVLASTSTGRSSPPDPTLIYRSSLRRV
jgi:hypothetical protein